MVSSLFASRHPLSLSHSPVRALNLYHEASSISWSTCLLPVGTTQLPASCPLDRVLCTSKVGTRGATPMLIAPQTFRWLLFVGHGPRPLDQCQPFGAMAWVRRGRARGPARREPFGPAVCSRRKSGVCVPCVVLAAIFVTERRSGCVTCVRV